MENKTAIVLKSSIKKAHLKPSFIQIFMAKMNISKKETKALSLIFYGVFFILCCLFFMLLPSNPIKYLLVLGIVILCGVAVYLFYTKKIFCFIRVIEKKVSQGRYTNKTYHVQSLISKTENEKILETNDLKWTDYYPDEFKNAVDRGNAANYFVQKTTKIEVIDEAC
tara:strand:- start:130038 stop:130538 length:501 start_codon:yes stop_codon:yes gene_type:complete